MNSARNSFNPPGVEPRGHPRRFAVSLLLAALLVAACGSTAATPTATATPKLDAAQTAQAALDAISKTTVKMTRPTESYPIGNHKVSVIATGLGTPGATDLAVFVQEAIVAAGWTAAPTGDGKFKPAIQSGLIQDAVNGGTEALILIAITPANVASAIQLASSKNIPIICVLCGPPDTYSQFPGIVGVEPSPENVGKAQANYVIAKSQAKAKVWVYVDNEFLFTAAQNKAALAALAAGCPTCDVHQVEMKAGDEQKPGVPILASVLAANPKGSIDYIIAPFDNAAANFSKALEAQSRSEIGVLGYAALPVFFSQIAAGAPVSAQATVSIPIPYMGWSALDETGRVLNKKASWDATGLGVAIVTRTNYSSYDAKSPWVSPDFDFKAEFKKMWGK